MALRSGSVLSHGLPATSWLNNLRWEQRTMINTRQDSSRRPRIQLSSAEHSARQWSTTQQVRQPPNADRSHALTTSSAAKKSRGFKYLRKRVAKAAFHNSQQRLDPPAVPREHASSCAAGDTRLDNPKRVQNYVDRMAPRRSGCRKVRDLPVNRRAVHRARHTGREFLLLPRGRDEEH